MNRVIVDAGPIVSFIDHRDRYHDWAVEQHQLLEPPFLTCEAALAEAFFLTARLGHGPRELMSYVSAGLLRIPFRIADHLPSIEALLTKYSDVPMSLTDACLVRMVEQNPGASVLTVDSDFRIYRQHGRRQIPLIIPDDR